jgi:hypothetical protein
MKNIVKNGKTRVEKPDKNASLRRLEFMPRKPRLKVPFKNSISGLFAGEMADITKDVLHLCGVLLHCPAL